MPCKLTPEDKAQLKQGLQEAFKKFDKDNSGAIDAKEFESVVLEYNKQSPQKKPMDAKQLANDFISLADKNKDGKVNFDEFYNFLLTAIESC